MRRRVWIYAGLVLLCSGVCWAEMSISTVGVAPATRDSETGDPATQPAGPMVDNPEYLSWAKHAVGTQVTMKMQVTVTNAGATSVLEERVTQRLVKVSGEAAAVEIRTEPVGGGDPDMAPMTQQAPAKLKKGAAVNGDAGEWVKGMEGRSGEEAVEVLGKMVNTRRTESTTKVGPKTWEVSEWRSEEVPGDLVKLTMTLDGGGMHETTTETLVGVAEGAGGAATQPAGK